MPTAYLLGGDNRRTLQAIADSSIDAIVTDPPYGLGAEPDMTEVLEHWLRGDDWSAIGGGFMGRTWDSFVPGPATWREALRVLKPGGHVLMFSGTRTFDIATLALRLAGFEIRDTLSYMYGSGFPKSLSVHKATVERVASRYGDARCSCVDTGAGRVAGDDVGRRGSASDRPVGGGGVQAPEEAGDPELSVDESGPAVTGVRELWEVDQAETAGRGAIEASVLLDEVRGGRPTSQRLGHAEVRAGMEEPAGEDQGQGQGVPGLLEDPGTERDGPPRSPPETVPVRGVESDGEPCGPVRLMPPCDRSADERHAGVDPGRCDPRRTLPDDHVGRDGALAEVCSWCGLPDTDWIDSLSGLGTALKPAWEPIVLARKPLAGTVASTVLAHGTGALNIDATRIGVESTQRTRTTDDFGRMNDDGWVPTPGVDGSPAGRFPANVVLSHTPDCELVGTKRVKTGTAVRENLPDGGSQLGHVPIEPPTQRGENAGFADTDGLETVEDWVCVDDCPVKILDDMTGVSGEGRERSLNRTPGGVFGNGADQVESVGQMYGDIGGASRFFYTSKTSRDERNRGMPSGVVNDHPTVKPVELMRWLVKLITPPGGLVLDPFVGSGSTGVAACLEQHDFIGCDSDPHSVMIAKHRIRWSLAEVIVAGPSETVNVPGSGPLTLFG